MHTYIIDAAGVLSGPVDLPVIPGIGVQVPSNAVQIAIKLAKPAAGNVWALIDGQPKQLADHRGAVYRTDSGEQLQHAELGPLPVDLTAQPRPSADHRWDGQGWELDVELQAANRAALTETLCTRIDTAADSARQKVAGDPLRAVEYDRARIEAEAFAAADYQGDVPPMVAAWAINGRTAQEAADDILHEAARYTAALIALRETRLAAKEQVRTLMDVGKVEQAQELTKQTITAIEAAVAGVGNNPVA